MSPRSRARPPRRPRRLRPRCSELRLPAGLRLPAALAGLVLALGLGGCLEGYDNNDGELAVRQRAKEMCSCLFVQQRDEDYCRAYTRVTPDVAKPEIDYGRKRVTATALGFYRSAASFRPGLGCALEQ